MNSARTAWELSSLEMLTMLPLYLVFVFYHQKYFDLVVICIHLELSFPISIAKREVILTCRIWDL